jgi:predicted ferric reductase
VADTGLGAQGAFALRSGAWIAVYLLVVLAPLFALLLGQHPPARGFGTEFSAAIGYAGLAMMGLQFGLTARFRFVTRPWGEDVIYHFHRQISLVAVALVLAHPLILFWLRPERLALLNVVTAPWRARFASASVYALLALVVVSLWRVKLRIRYETWHAAHLLLALVAIWAGLLHAIGWAFYLDSPLKYGLWVAIVVFWIGLLLYTRLVRPFFLLRRPYRVVALQPERGDSVTVRMRPDGHRGLRFSPGQFAWLSTVSPFRITGHPFSLSSSAGRADGDVEMTIRNLGDFTATLGGVRPDSRVWVDGPYGAFTMGSPADLHVLIAGGIGITPMMSMLRTLADRADRRPVILLYGNRDWDSITFREEIEALQTRVNLSVVHILADPPADWTGARGRLTAETLQRHVPAPLAAHEYFICGPGPMMDAAESLLAALGVPVSKYHSERYSFA